MAAEFSGDTEPRIEDMFAGGGRLRRRGNPGRSNPIHLVRIEVLKPVEAAGGRRGPRTMSPHRLCVASRVALMIVKIAECTGGEDLLAIPDTYIMHVGACNDEELRADGLVPVGGCTELVIGNK